MERPSQRRVLFVDDDEVLLDVLDRYFTRVGYQVFTASSGDKGVRIFNQAQPEVVVVDLHLPDISGFSVLERIQSKRHMVIMLTGDGEVTHAVEAMRRGAENFLTKPIDMAHLEVAVEKAGEKAALYREVKKLSARSPYGLRRRVLQMASTGLFVIVSAGAGLLIGGRDVGAPVAPIPVPFDPQDTVITREESPLRPIPNPRPNGQARTR